MNSKKDKQLQEICDSSKNMETFLSFLDALKEDFLTNKDSWENWTIDSYLDSVHAWIKDYNKCGWTKNTANAIMGKYYE